MNTQYVVGFLFNAIGNVALIHKARPDWQAGRLNGIGGHIKPSENPGEAMQREFEEETGAVVIKAAWQHFCTLTALAYEGGEEAIVYFFTARQEEVRLKSTTDEPIVWVHRTDLANYKIIPNLHWLIPMAFVGPTGLRNDVWPWIVSETLPSHDTH